MNLRNILFALIGALLFAGPVSAQIQSGMPVTITISNVPDQDKQTVNGIYPVSESGMVNMPFIGHVRAAGLRNEQLAAALQAQYRSAGIYTHPTIQVITNTVEGSVAQETVVVGGFVRKAGKVAYNSQLTLWGAIQEAGGATEFGSMYRVRVTRQGKQKEYDLMSSSKYRQIPLERNDAIDVPQKNWRGR